MKRLHIILGLVVGIILIISTILLIQTQYSSVTSSSGTVLSEFQSSLNFNVYVSKGSSQIIDLEAIKKVTSVEIFDISSIPIIKDKSIIIFNINEIVSEHKQIFPQLQKLTARNIAIIWINLNKDVEKAKFALGVFSKSFGSKNIMPILPLDPNSIGTDKKQAPKIHPVIYSAQIFGISFSPNGVIIIEELKYIIEELSTIQRWLEQDSKLFVPAYLKDIQNYNYIGYIGWKTSYFKGQGCGETTGYMEVKVDYYYTVWGTFTKYHTWLAHTQHSAKGYKTSCGFTIYNHYPKTFISETDWKTSIWAGQVVDDWGPKNLGVASTISYTLPSVAATWYITPYVTIEYSIGITEPNSPYYEWFDRSCPHCGIAKVEHNVKVPSGYDESKLNYMLFTVEPSSIGFLDPNKDGGYLPMIISHTFTTYLNTGESETIQFSVDLWSTGVYEIK
jgi:hypothetical protein